MSLFEILIAIAVLSFMMLGVIQFTQTTFDTTERVTREDSEYLQIETAMSRFEWDISQLYSPLYFDHLHSPKDMSQSETQLYSQVTSGIEGNRRFNRISYTGASVPRYEREDKSTLVFFTYSNRRKIEDSKQSNFAWIKYSLEANDEVFDEGEEQKTTKERKKTQMLVRQISNQDIYNTEEIDWENIKAQVLHRKIVSLVFEFWDPKKFKWTENLKTIKNGQNIIYAVRVKIEYLNSDNLEQETLRIFRPLFPEFTPEDRYKFLNANPVKKSASPVSQEPKERGETDGE